MSAPAVLIIVYDYRVPGALELAHRHRAYWGRSWTEVHILDASHFALEFRPAPDERWRPWERTRQRWILGDSIATVLLVGD